MTAKRRIDNLRAVNRPLTPHPLWLDRVLLGVGIIAQALAWMVGSRPVALDPDAMNLAYGMQRFDITHFNPHAPGYLVYVWILRAVHLVTARGESLVERFATVQLVALLFGLASIVVVYRTARNLKLGPGAAGWSSLVMAVHPILVFHTIDGQTHASEAFASGLLLLVAVAYRRHPGYERAIGLGLVLALGSALRPSFVLFGIPVVVWTVGLGRFADLITAGMASMAGAMGWIVPTVYAAGGWSTWRVATRGLVHRSFVLTSSPFSDQAFGSLVWANELSLLLWSFEVFLPLVVAWGVVRVDRGPLRGESLRPSEARWLAGVLGIGGTLMVLYYAATFVSEPGYLAALLPPVALGVGVLSGHRGGVRAAALAVAAALCCWMLPELPRVLKVPSIAEWSRRTNLAVAYRDHVEQALPARGRYLAVIDHPDITVGRQLPMLSPHVDVLLIQDGRRPWIRQSSLTYVTADDTTPIPEAFGPRGAGASIATSRGYQGVYFDGSLAPYFQEQLAGQVSCPVQRASEITQAVLLADRCFPDGRIELDGLELRFGVGGAPLR